MWFLANDGIQQRLRLRGSILYGYGGPIGRLRRTHNVRTVCMQSSQAVAGANTVACFFSKADAGGMVDGLTFLAPPRTQQNADVADLFGIHVRYIATGLGHNVLCDGRGRETGGVSQIGAVSALGDNPFLHTRKSRPGIYGLFDLLQAMLRCPTVAKGQHFRRQRLAQLPQPWSTFAL